MTVKTLTTFLAHRTRKPTTVVDTVVLHATAGSNLSGALDTLRQNGFSYHYIIDKSGVITKCVPYSGVAYHAGSSYGPHEQAKGISTAQDPHDGFNYVTPVSVNEYTIGICFVNLNNGTDPYTEAQIDAAVELINELKHVFPSLRWLTTHYWVSPHRKTDPKTVNMAGVASRTGLTNWHR